MRYVNLHIVCKNEYDKSAQSISSKKNYFFGTKVKLPNKACFLAVGVYLKNFFICAVPIRNVNMLAIITETFKQRLTIKNKCVAY